MKLTSIDPEVYTNFVESHPLGNFLQSVPLAERRMNDGWKYDLLGLHNEAGELVATALLFSWRVFGSFYQFECLEGPLIAYEDAELTAAFLAELRAFVRNQGGIELLIQPPVLASHRDGNATQIDDYTADDIITTLNASQFTQLRGDERDIEKRYGRWYYTKDLTPFASYGELLTNLGSKMKNQILSAQKNGVKVVDIIDPTELDAFIEVLMETGERRNFNARNEAYYKSFFEAFSRDQAKFRIAYLDVASYEQSVTDRLAQLQQAIDAIPTDDELQAGALRELRAQYNAYDTRLKELPELRAQTDAHGRLILTAAIFMHVGPELVYFMSGSRAGYGRFNGPYALQADSMKYAIEHGIPKYNFYVTNGTFNGRPEQDGVYQFKRKFNGIIEEQIGCFVYHPSNLAARLVRFVRKLRSLHR